MIKHQPVGRRQSSARRDAAHHLADRIGFNVEHHARHVGGGQIGAMTPKGVREVFSLRAILESFAVRLCMMEGHYGRREMEEIGGRYEVLRRSVVGGDEFSVVEADMDFHWAICAPCGHEMLLEQLKSLQTRSRVCIFLTKFYDSDVVNKIEAHAPILAAIRASHTKTAEEAMHSHITNAGERLLIRMIEVENRSEVRVRTARQRLQ